MPSSRRLYLVKLNSRATQHVAVEAAYEGELIKVLDGRYPGQITYEKLTDYLENGGEPFCSPATVDFWLPVEWRLYIAALDRFFNQWGLQPKVSAAKLERMQSFKESHYKLNPDGESK